ncbi:thioredoxin family protein [Roseicyclus sp.]|uniref:thioredoxin family protein n=1 Tax=Roseicyclus sp. TaxID=1914329 RepID=UPI003FA17F46
MNRRDFLIGASALALVPLSARAADLIDYAPGLPEARLAAGETVLLDVYAPWCGTCRAQSRAMEELRAANPAYDAAITFIRMDWDTYGGSDYARGLGVERRSTLILMRGDAILGRVVADTRVDSIRALMDLALT